MFDLGMQELIVIFIVALLVFGPKKLPELGKSLGKGLAELKRAMHGVKEQMDAELSEIKNQVSITDIHKTVDTKNDVLSSYSQDADKAESSNDTQQNDNNQELKG